MIKKEQIKNYIKTVVATLFVVTIVVGFTVFDVAKKTRSRLETATGKIATSIVNSNIRELLLKAEEHPDDYTINLKLATLYEENKNLINAEREYRNALVKAPRSELALYRYAILCIGQNRFDDAILLIENIADSADEGIILKKLLAYQTMGDKLLENEDYLNATKMYTLGYKYGKILNDKRTKTIVNKLTNSYMLLADEEISDNNYEQAVLSLETLLKYTNSPEAKYKLALIAKPTNPKKSAKEMGDLLTLKPELVNLELYYSILSDLISAAKKEGHVEEERFYYHKQIMLKKFISKNYVFSDEFTIENTEFIGNFGLFNKKYFTFDIKNNGLNRINKLNLMVVVTFPNKEKLEKKLLLTFNNKNKILKEHIEIEIHDKNYTKNLQDQKRASIEIYAKKNRKFDWVLLKTLSILYK